MFGKSSINEFVNEDAIANILLGPLCYKLITVVNCYLETGLSCIVY